MTHPTDSAPQGQRFMTSTEAAEYLNLSPNTLKSYLDKGSGPTPDAYIGRVKGWTKTTLDHWKNNRLGRGYRTDLDRVARIEAG